MIKFTPTISDKINVKIAKELRQESESITKTNIQY